MLFSSVKKILAKQARSICCATTKSNGILHPYNTVCTIPKRYAVTNYIGIRISNFMDRLKVINPVNKSKYEAKSWLLYEHIVDQILYVDIMKKLDLPDTFNSWFTITELHLWMIFVRIMHEGTKGSMIRNSITEALWNDVHFRSKKLGYASADIRNNQIKELNAQFRGALIGYDEGWLTNDMVLASMVWRRIFNQKCEDPEKLELVVRYIRKQMSILQLQTFESLFTKKEVQWIKFV